MLKFSEWGATWEAETGGSWELNWPVSLAQWFSAFLILQPFNTVPRVGDPPNHNIISVANFINVHLLLLGVVM